jgi:hypothetical protein
MKPIAFCLLVILSFSISISPGAQAAQREAAGQSGYNLVIFPIRVITPWGEGYLRRTEILAVEGVVDMIENDAVLELKYTYLQTGDTAGAVLLKDAVGGKSINVWRQMSLLSNFSPDWSRVRTIGAEIDADIAVLIRIKKDDSSFVAIYLYDYKKKKIYSKTSKGIYWGSIAAGVRKMTEALMQDFYDNQ